MMKKLLAAIVIAIGISSVSTVPSYASNDDAAYFLGGMLGGMILNDALRGPRYYAPPPPPRYYAPAYDEPVYERVCTRRWVRVWDKNRHEYVKVRRKTCELVRVY